jgi:hypothetical protein
MAVTNGYATLVEAKARLDIVGDSQNATIEQMIEAASRQIDGWCGRSFFVETATRTLTASYPDVLELDRDLLTVTSIATDADGSRTYATAWAAADYDLGDGPPYGLIYTSPVGAQAFPVGRGTVRVTGTWGYAAEVPHAIREACLLLVGRLFKRRDAPFGVAGSADHGQLLTLPGMDPDVKQLLMPYRRFGLVGV